MSSEKLELKHLTGYLPYGLKAEQTIFTQFKKITHKEIRLVNSTTIFNFFELGRHKPEEHVKPILRPISDLTKEIEHNGEKLVPYKEFKKIFYNIDWQYINLDPFSVEISLDSNSGVFFGLSFEEITGIIQKLHEWNFDIHGLIIKGLAIDINTL